MLPKRGGELLKHMLVTNDSPERNKKTSKMAFLVALGWGRREEETPQV